MEIKNAFGIEQEKRMILGKEYTLQNMPHKQYYMMQERCRDENGLALPSKMYDEIFANVVIEPRVTWDDFENVDDIEEFMKEVFSFLKRRKSKKETE